MLMMLLHQSHARSQNTRGGSLSGRGIGQVDVIDAIVSVDDVAVHQGVGFLCDHLGG
jgi:hypothetical protein